MRLAMRLGNQEELPFMGIVSLKSEPRSGSRDSGGADLSEGWTGKQS